MSQLSPREVHEFWILSEQCIPKWCGEFQFTAHLGSFLSSCHSDPGFKYKSLFSDQWEVMWDFIYIYTCMYIHIHTNHIYTYTQIYKYIPVHTHTCVCTCIPFLKKLFLISILTFPRSSTRIFTGPHVKYDRHLDIIYRYLQNLFAMKMTFSTFTLWITGLACFPWILFIQNKRN